MAKATRGGGATGRVLMLVGLTVGFYATAFVIVVALVVGPIWVAVSHSGSAETSSRSSRPFDPFEVDGSDPGLDAKVDEGIERVVSRNYLKFVFAAVAIGAACWPARVRTRRTGPLVTRKDQPRLISFLEEVAEDCGQPMPDVVQIDLDPNASIERLPGRRGRTTITLGLPLLQVLRLSELRAIVAHEFGHHAGGDTRMASWVYRTHVALSRILRNATEVRYAVRLPFLAYGWVFNRLSRSVCRNQEFAADEFSVEVFGAEPMRRALRSAQVAGAAFRPFLGICEPVIAQGLRPPIMDGFSAYLKHLQRDGVLKRVLADAMSQREPDPEDTHPPLAARLAVLEEDSGPGPSEKEGPARSLLDQTARLEAVCARWALSRPDFEKLPLVGWDEVGEAVHAKQWETLASIAPHELTTGITTDSVARAPLELAGRVGDGIQGAPEGGEQALGLQVLWALVCLTLRRDGWRAEHTWDDGVVLTQGTTTRRPWADLGALVRGELDQATWLDRYRGSGAPFGDVLPPPQRRRARERGAAPEIAAPDAPYRGELVWTRRRERGKKPFPLKAAAAVLGAMLVLGSGWVLLGQDDAPAAALVIPDNRPHVAAFEAGWNASDADAVAAGFSPTKRDSVRRYVTRFLAKNNLEALPPIDAWSGWDPRFTVVRIVYELPGLDEELYIVLKADGNPLSWRITSMGTSR